MNIIRSDIVGSIDMRLVSRPTNTAIGIDNFFLVADGRGRPFPARILRFIGTDEGFARARYNSAMAAAQAVYEAAAS